jgi:hypothetical protein
MREIVSPLDGFNSPFGTRRRALAPFSPAILFAAGNDGLWFDDDPATKFLDTAGTELAAIGQSVALELDKSPNSNNATQGTTTFRPTRQTDGIQYDGSDDRQTTPYRPTLAGSIIARFNGATASRVVLGSQAATDGRAFLGLDASGRLAAGIGAQGTAVIQDQEAGRRNLLTFTEAFDNAVWGSPGGATWTALASDPFGAYVLTENTSTGLHRQVPSTNQASFVTGVTYVASAEVKLIAGTRRVQIGSGSAATINYSAAFDLVSGTVVSGPGSIEALGDGWFRISATATATATNNLQSHILQLLDGTAASYTGDGTSAIAFRKPQLEFGSTATDYQPILGVTLGDLRNAWHTGAVTWDGTTVKLYLDGAEVYSAAQSGAVNTTVDMFKGALNANGTAAGFWQGRIEHAIALDRVLTPAEITNITAFWS